MIDLTTHKLRWLTRGSGGLLLGVLGLLAVGCTTEVVGLPQSGQRALAHQLLADGLTAYERGQYETAIGLWQRSEHLYAADGNASGEIDAKRNQATALRAMGIFGLATGHLRSAVELAEALGDHERIIAAQNDLGAVLTLTRQLPGAHASLEQALAMATEDNDLSSVASICNNLGNLLRVEGRLEQSMQQYYKCAEIARQSGQTFQSAQALVNAAGVAVLSEKFDDAFRLNRQALAIIHDLSDTHNKADLLITVAESLLRLSQQRPDQRAALIGDAHDAYDAAIRVAGRIDDNRGLSYAQGGLGQLHEMQGDLELALEHTRQAIAAAGKVPLHDALFRWHWQSGRVLAQQGHSDRALAAYYRSTQTLELIRYDVAVGLGNRQVSFRQEVGPLFFELADLLLKRSESQSDQQREREDLLAARRTIEQFKTAEMVDYFQDQCVGLLKATQEAIETVSEHTAVVYPIIFPDRIELLVSFRDDLKRFTSLVDRDRFTQEVHNFRIELETLSTRKYLRGSQQLYQWLIAPVESELQSREIDTLVFVPDGPLRLIPMAALHDGDQFLIRRYATAITPGLTLTDPKPFRRSGGRLLACGLSTPRQPGFAPLPHVPQELNEITKMFGGTQLLNEAFSLARVKQEMAEHSYSAVHIASHAKFGRLAQDTLILLYDTELTLAGLEQLIRPARFRDQPVELLTLSACQTAAGDDRTALGLAGIALKAGAHSAVATLWPIQDSAAAVLLAEFYRQLKLDDTISKAKALQRAQVKILDDWQYDDPFFWSAFLLIGEWL